MAKEELPYELNDLFPHMVKWRRHLHRYPELSFQEEKTSRFIAERLLEMGCEVREKVGGYGLVAAIKGNLPGPVIALRADMDALPIQDEKDCEYASTVKGVMHACGHDGHTAALLAVASYYQKHREGLAGERRLLFQPAEESTPGGAVSMIRDGALEGADAVYGVHLWTPLPYGQVSSKPGAFMAATDEFTIEITGLGGHGGMPHKTIDTVIIGSALVQALQTIVSRSVNPLDSAVVTIGSFHAGTANNVIAEKCELKGTIRTFNEYERERIRKRIEQMVRHTCEMHGAKYQFDLRVGYPPVVNDEREAARFMQVGEQLFGAEAVQVSDAIMVAEDFSYYLQRVPGCFMFVGAGNEEVGASYAHHHPMFNFDERAMKDAASLLIAMAENYADEAEK
ncbi:amidohydrolase [Paenibacillus protaetiae]|uniref:Amidohydrolase n=2 Tax=Paenibacillus protaetiae TaxID=2509456 RepID=A0A4P6EY38_9BACL|nr:M20 family metallopeptidase [Paenibacillus protaetiae]QAY68320.1 amidohydrolase [Paenibacillus protaetiae]